MVPLPTRRDDGDDQERRREAAADAVHDAARRAGGREREPRGRPHGGAPGQGGVHPAVHAGPAGSAAPPGAPAASLRPSSAFKFKLTTICYNFIHAGVSATQASCLKARLYKPPIGPAVARSMPPSEGQVPNLGVVPVSFFYLMIWRPLPTLHIPCSCAARFSV